MGSGRAAQRGTAGPRWHCHVTRAASKAAAGIPRVACQCKACHLPARTPRSHRNLPLRLSRLPQDGSLHPQHGRQRRMHFSIPAQRDLQVFKLRGSRAGEGLIASTGCDWAPGTDRHAVPCTVVARPPGGCAVWQGPCVLGVPLPCYLALLGPASSAPTRCRRTCKMASDVRPS